MIIHGHYYKTIYKLAAIKEPCPNCKQRLALQPGVKVKVNHIYGIPLYPKNKISCIACAICKEVYSIRDFMESAHLETELLQNAKHKWYHFIGLFFMSCILILVFLGFLEIKKDTDKTNAIEKNYMIDKINKLSENDVFFYKIENDEITSFKVNEVKSDTIFGYENLQSTNASRYTIIDRTANYSKTRTFYIKQQLQTMLEDDKIMYTIN